jgi:uncharacterized membrane protein YebE (DUF533 family)
MSDLQTGAPAVQSEQEAYLTMLVLCSRADGYIGEHEMEEIENMLALKHLFGDVEDVKSLINSAFDHVKERGSDREALVAQCAALVTDKEGLFANCVELTMSDGFVGESEKGFIEMLHRKLGLSTSRADEILQVLMLKNK